MNTRYGVALALVLTALAPAARAQQPAHASSVGAMVPTTATASVAVHSQTASRAAAIGELAPPARRHTDSYTGLMIVGFAALLAGAIIGGSAGTIIMIGGAFVGLYGLYMYLQ
ncbi:MAG: hypothetical protein NVS1B4_18810 [Gemmatimonadaceae bacterium]